MKSYSVLAYDDDGKFICVSRSCYSFASACRIADDLEQRMKCHTEIKEDDML